MRNTLHATAIALALAVGITTSAAAFDHVSSLNGRYPGGLHSDYSSFRETHVNRRDRTFSGIRGFISWRNGGWGASRFSSD
jgi:hypothetical protein